MSRQNPVEKAISMLRDGSDPEWVRQQTGVSLPRLEMLQKHLGAPTENQEEAAPEKKEETLW